MTKKRKITINDNSFPPENETRKEMEEMGKRIPKGEDVKWEEFVALILKVFPESEMENGGKRIHIKSKNIKEYDQ
jgi:hypothetical protein